MCVNSYASVKWTIPLWSDLAGKLGRHMYSAIEKELIGLSIARE